MRWASRSGWAWSWFAAPSSNVSETTVCACAHAGSPAKIASMHIKQIRLQADNEVRNYPIAQSRNAGSAGLCAEVLKLRHVGRQNEQERARELPRVRPDEHVLRGGVHVAKTPLQRARLVDRRTA